MEGTDLFHLQEQKLLRETEVVTLVAAGNTEFWKGPPQGAYWLITALSGVNDTRPTEIRGFKRTRDQTIVQELGYKKVTSQESLYPWLNFPSPEIVTYGQEIGVRARQGQIADTVTLVILGWEVFQSE